MSIYDERRDGIGYFEDDLRDKELIKMERRFWKNIGEILVIVCTGLGLAVLIVLWLLFP